MTRFLLLPAVLALAPGASVALAESHTDEDHEASGDHSGGGTAAEAEAAPAGEGTGGMDGVMADMPAHMQGMMGAMDMMMEAMPTESTGDPDADFLLMMIPHHQSAVEMARVLLEQGDDEETRALAQAVIDAQEAEIAQMRAMLGRLGVEAPAE